MKEIKAYLESELVEFGFFKLNDDEILKAYPSLKFGISIIYPLSCAIVENIKSTPTIEYFHHYRTVNAKLDAITLKLIRLLENNGNNAIAIASSQSSNENPYVGLISHKLGAVLSMLGTIGKNNLFISEKHGTGVRLATVLTDFRFEEINNERRKVKDVCQDCNKCVVACPAGAITGKLDIENSEMFDAEKCSKFMKKAYMHIGRGVVCGRCMSVCPYCAQVNC